jgi:hypothetical protein
MTWYSDYHDAEEDINGLIEVYAWEDENTASKKLVYKIDKRNSQIKFFPKDSDFVVKEVLIEGFDKLPPEFSELGYIKSINYFLTSRLSQYKVNSLVISKSKVDSFRKVPNKKSYNVVLSYRSFAKLKSAIATITSTASADKSSYADEFFHTAYPKFYKKVDTRSSNGVVKRAIQNLDASAISDLTRNDIDKLIDFFSILITKRYTSPSDKAKLLSAAKIQVDQVAIKDVINQFEKLLKSDHPESDWSTFLQTNLFLLNSEYVAVVPELNLTLASQRKVDFGLVNAYGYLYIFEIKKPNTQLLAKSLDRGNYYWSADAVKAITQAEKYLFHAERKASALKEDIRRERSIDAIVTRPKAFLLIGSSSQLTKPEMKEDLRILRDSLKNVEVILYDELLTRLKNQMNKVYARPAIDTKEANKVVLNEQ